MNAMSILGNVEKFGKNRDIVFTNSEKKLSLESTTTTADVVPTPKKIRVLFCGTYPIGQSNGYSRVVYYVAKLLGRKEDIQLTIYGFQNFNKKTVSERKDIPENVTIHDAYLCEEPKRSGFGEKEIGDYIKSHPQDIVIIFNDMTITSSVIKGIYDTLSEEERATFKLIVYMDQVYPYHRPRHISILNKYADGVILFTKYWEETVRNLGLRKEIPTYIFPHGFDHLLYFPIPVKIARLYYGIPEEPFIVLNLNRNQPRKRWDHTIMAFAKVVQRHYELKRKQPSVQSIRLMIATAMEGAWNLSEIYQNELKKRDIPLEEGMRYLINVSNPQNLTDYDINILYNSCDIGINTCDGEGFGLCQFEHLAVGKPQIVSNIGGFKEYISSKNSTILQPKLAYYIDNVRDNIGGYGELSDPDEFADAIWEYYTSSDKVARHGNVGRKEIVKKYKWADMIELLYESIHRINESTRTPPSL